MEDVAERFHAMHKLRMGHAYPGQPVRAISYRARLVVPQPPLTPGVKPAGQPGSGQVERGEIRWGGRQVPCAYVRRASLTRDDTVSGAALVEDDSASTFIPPGWTARSDAQGALIIERAKP